MLRNLEKGKVHVEAEQDRAVVGPPHYPWHVGRIHELAGSDSDGWNGGQEIKQVRDAVGKDRRRPEWPIGHDEEGQNQERAVLAPLEGHVSRVGDRQGRDADDVRVHGATEEDWGVRNLDFIVPQDLLVGPQKGHRHFVDEPLPRSTLLALRTLRACERKAIGKDMPHVRYGVFVLAAPDTIQDTQERGERHDIRDDHNQQPMEGEWFPASLLDPPAWESQRLKSYDSGHTVDAIDLTEGCGRKCEAGTCRLASKV